jgi:signal transduction histidine kinase
VVIGPWLAKVAKRTVTEGCHQMRTAGSRSLLSLRRNIDRIAAHAAVIDETGVIVAVNGPWRRFARENGLRDETAGEGTSYLRVCEAPQARGTEGPAVAREIHRIIGGSEEPFRVGYACHAPGHAAWFQAEVASLRKRGRARVLVTHAAVAEGAIRREIAETERRHIARELHDTTAQNLAYALLDLEQVAREERARCGAVSQRLSGAIELCRRSLDDVRCLSYELGPPGLVPGRLVRSLKRLGATFGRRAGLAVMLLASPVTIDDDLSLESTEALYRTAEESLNNVRRHALAHRVSLRIRRAGDGVRLEVIDDGKGIAADAEQGKGLSDARERLEACGGRLEIPATRRGTLIRATVPAEKGEHAVDRHRG